MNYSPSKSEILSQLARIKKNSAIGRSSNLLKLFEYLIVKETEKIEQNFDNCHLPKELEIAIDVFGKDAEFNSAEDASIRVHISRLRKKLELYYSTIGQQEAFYISIPVGEYRLVFLQRTAETTHPSANLNSDITLETKTKSNAELTLNSPHSLAINQKVANSKQLSKIIILAFCLFTLTVHMVLFSFQSIPNEPELPLNNHTLWLDYQQPKHKNIIVLGAQSSKTVTTHSQNSLHSENRLISKNMALAVKNILSISKNFRYTPVIYASELSVNDIKHANIIYIGHYQNMALLTSYFNASELTFDADNFMLKNKNNHTEYLSPVNIAEQYIDYGLFAKIHGPRNNKIYLISGFTDSSLLWLSWFLTSDNDTANEDFGSSLSDYQINNGENFELLFKIPSMNGADMGHELISSSAIISEKIWNTL